MGLDMFAFAVPRPLATAAVDFKAPETDGFQQLHYWRKHPNLHGWMEALYRSKGGQSELFNCTTVELTASAVADARPRRFLVYLSGIGALAAKDVPEEELPFVKDLGDRHRVVTNGPDPRTTPIRPS